MLHLARALCNCTFLVCESPRKKRDDPRPSVRRRPPPFFTFIFFSLSLCLCLGRDRGEEGLFSTYSQMAYSSRQRAVRVRQLSNNLLGLTLGFNGFSFEEAEQLLKRSSLVRCVLIPGGRIRVTELKEEEEGSKALLCYARTHARAQERNRRERKTAKKSKERE